MSSDSVFPVPEIVDRKGQSWGGEPGLTKRELFALAALQAVYPTILKAQDRPELVAQLAIAQADALLKELSK